uniref:Uncharacterized protein n=1 Tax=Panagrellus redivivus TaxID=6233 RepID=A0A7E4W8B6_PANRE
MHRQDLKKGVRGHILAGSKVRKRRPAQDPPTSFSAPTDGVLSARSRQLDGAGTYSLQQFTWGRLAGYWTGSNLGYERSIQGGGGGSTVSWTSFISTMCPSK